MGAKSASSVTTINNNGKETFYARCKQPAGQVLQSFKEYEFKVCLFSHITYFCVRRCGDVLAEASDVRELKVRYLKSHCLLRQRTAVHIISLQTGV